MKKDYAHIMGLARNPSDEKERVEAWLAKQADPYPKLSSGFFSSSLVINTLELECLIDRQSLLVYNIDGPGSFSEGIRIEEKMKSRDTPVSIFTSSHFVFPTDFDPSGENTDPKTKAVYAAFSLECKKMLDDAKALTKLGIHVFSLAKLNGSAHKYPVSDREGQVIGEGWDVGLFHVSEKPFDPKQPEARIFGSTAPRLWPDTEGATMFLAYLLNKNYVIEQDIPIGKSDVPFGQQMLRQARSASYQDKIKNLSL